jgi:hypothetical protein
MQWQPQLGNPGARVSYLDELEQSLMLVLTTPERSVPGRPNFGSRLYQLADEPVSTLRPAVVREVVRALGVNEPRVRPLGVDVAHLDAGHLEVAIEWQPAASTERRTTRVVI